MQCPSCGASTPAEARFCPTCGHALQARADERRIVTVVFADLVGFTTFSEERDPERVKNLVDRCFQRLVADVTAYGGRVDKIVGDCVVALFGAPVAHEDDAERAVRAALQMQRTLASLNGQLDVHLQLRIGVNTGEVLVGAFRAGGDYTAMGDVVNVASRLQTLARPGQVVVGPATFAATREAVEYECLGEVQARGREGPITAWEARAALAPPGHRLRRPVTPLIGRDEELGLLRHALAAVTTRRRAHLVLILGEAGIGKSRLAAELASEALAGRRALVLEGRCVPYGEANVWWPVAEAVRQACDIEPADPAEVSADKCLDAVHRATGLPRESPEVARLVEGLQYLMGDEDALADVDPTRAAEDARRSLLALLEALASQQPVVLILSELHWADALVLDLVDHVLDRVRALPVMLVATARTELEDRWVPKPGRHNLVVLNLDPLQEPAARDLLASLLGEEPPPGVRDLLLERSGGNPFFLEELVALLNDAGVLAARAGHEPRPSLAEAARTQELPATLHGLVAARLDALPAAERSTLEDAAVLGRVGQVEALRALAAARGVLDIGAALDGLAAKDLLAVTDGQCEFRSELVREVAYETLTKAERARRHAAVADWLRGTGRRTGREDEYLERIAHHYSAAAELVREVGSVAGVPGEIGDIALDAIERAAVRAKQRDQHIVSVRLLDRAWRLLPPGAHRAQRRVLLERARARVSMHDLAGAREDLDEVFRQIEGGDHPRSRAKALTVRGHLEQTEGRLPESTATLSEAIDQWRALGDRQGMAEALRLQGMSKLFLGDPAAAEVCIREALDAFRELGAGRDEAWALWNLAWIAFEERRLDVAAQRLERSQAAFAAAGDWGGMKWAVGMLGWVRYFEGRRAEAEQLALQAGGDLRGGGEAWASGMVLMLVASVRLWEGRTAESVEPAQEALRHFASIGDGGGQLMATAVLSRALVATGRVGEGLAALEDARRFAGEATPMGGNVDWGVAAAGVAVHVGDGQRALDALAELGAPSRHLPEVAVYQGLALLHEGRVAEALAPLEDAFAKTSVEGPRAAAAAALALGRAATGDAAGAEAAAEATLAIGSATYHDAALAHLARAFAAVGKGDPAACDDAFRNALAAVDPTGDRVTQTVVRLARARALEALHSDEADDALADAQSHLDLLGLPALGWDTIFRLASTLQRKDVVGDRG